MSWQPWGCCLKVRDPSDRVEILASPLPNTARKSEWMPWQGEPLEPTRHALELTPMADKHPEISGLTYPGATRVDCWLGESLQRLPGPHHPRLTKAWITSATLT